MVPSLKSHGGSALDQAWTRVSLARPTTSSAEGCWTLTDGAAGIVSQVRGLSAAVGLPSIAKTTVLRNPWKRLPSAWIPTTSRVFRDPATLEALPPPRLVVSSGRHSITASLYLKKVHGDRTFTVHIQDPKIDPARFDLVIAPQHDGLTGDNVIQSLGAIHHVTKEVLAAAAEAPPKSLLRLGRPFVAVLLGGPNRSYDFSASDIDRLMAGLNQIVNRDAVRLAVLPSRRTPSEALRRLKEQFAVQHLVWDGEGENPYLASLALASHLVVTGDSVSMTSEAAATGKPVYTLELTEKRRARRFRRFHQSFREAGITRPFAGRLDVWHYQPPNDTAHAAALVRERIAQGAGEES